MPAGSIAIKRAIINPETRHFRCLRVQRRAEPLPEGPSETPAVCCLARTPPAMHCPEAETGMAPQAVAPGHCKLVESAGPSARRSDSPGSHSSSSSALGGISLASPPMMGVTLGSPDADGVVNAVAYGSAGWRDAPGAVPEGSASVGLCGRSSQSETNSHEGDGESMDGERLMKDFVNGLGSYFQVEGHVGGVMEELRVNANALGSRRGPPSSSSQFRGVTRHR